MHWGFPGDILEFAALPRPEKGLYCLLLFSMFIQRQYKPQLPKGGNFCCKVLKSGRDASMEVKSDERV
jgi:hypothetical protein